MTPEAAKLAFQFLGRVQLSGQEVPAFNAVLAALEADMNPASEDTGELPPFTVKQPDDD